MITGVGFVRVYGVGWGWERRKAGTFGCCGRGKVLMVVTGVLLRARWGLEWNYRMGWLLCRRGCDG